LNVKRVLPDEIF